MKRVVAYLKEPAIIGESHDEAERLCLLLAERMPDDAEHMPGFSRKLSPSARLAIDRVVRIFLVNAWKRRLALAPSKYGLALGKQPSDSNTQGAAATGHAGMVEHLPGA